MNKQIFSLIIGILLISCISASLGTFKQGDCVDIKTITNASVVTISTLSYPNGTIAASEKTMQNIAGNTFNYTFCDASAIGSYIYDYYDDESNTYVNDFSITPSGRANMDSMPSFLMGALLIVFGIACIFLFLAANSIEVGPKIFFLLSGLVFLIGSVALSYVIATESNVTSGISETLSFLLYALGIILFVIFAYVLIKQIVSIMEIMRIKKGYSMGNISRFGYNYGNQKGVM